MQVNISILSPIPVLGPTSNYNVWMLILISKYQGFFLIDISKYQFKIVFLILTLTSLSNEQTTSEFFATLTFPAKRIL